jgi:hypothetical protein
MKGSSPLMIYIKEERLGDFRKELRNNPSSINGANKDVMLLILKPLMQQAGQRVEWDYAERERLKKRIV